MEDVFTQLCNKKLRKGKSLSTLDKINDGISVMAVVFLIFRKQFELLNTTEAQIITTHLRSCIPLLQANSTLEEISNYLHTLPRQEFSNLVKQLIVACQPPSNLNVAN